MSDDRRVFVRGGTFFFTLVIFDRQPFLSSDLSRQIQRRVWKIVQDKFPFRCDGNGRAFTGTKQKDIILKTGGKMILSCFLLMKNLENNIFEQILLLLIIQFVHEKGGIESHPAIAKYILVKRGYKWDASLTF